MSGRRGSITDYPEHLNPFYEGNEKFRFWKFGKIKRSGSFGESLRNTLTLKSFRGKKKDKRQAPSSPPEIRKNVTNFGTVHRQTLPTTLSPIYSPARSSVPVPLPRSRFSERVAKSTANSDEVPNGHLPIDSAHEHPPSVNPFDEEEKLAALRPKRIRRRKRRAPLPPNMTREEGDAYLGVSSMHNLSKWSLTSVETDISYSESESLPLDIVNQEMSQIMNNITKEMEKMTDETNNSDQTKETDDEQPLTDIPDLIASSAEGHKNEKLQASTENVAVNEVTENGHGYDDTPTDENSNVVSKFKCIDETESENINCDKEITKEDDEVLSKQDSNANSICEDSNQEIVYNSTYNHVSDEQDINFNERKSLYITASNDQLDKSDSLTNVSDTTDIHENTEINENNNCSTLPSSPKRKTEVSVILNTIPNENSVEQDETDPQSTKLTETTPASSPVPKMRTHKLSKGDLLGSDATASA